MSEHKARHNENVQDAVKSGRHEEIDDGGNGGTLHRRTEHVCWAEEPCGSLRRGEYGSAMSRVNGNWRSVEMVTSGLLR